MAQLSTILQIAPSDTRTTGSTQLIPLGTRAFDSSGNEYIYARGTASVVSGDFVTFSRTDYSVERANANDIGFIGVAGTAILANQFGWYQIYGQVSGANVATGATSPRLLYLTSTDGRVGTTDVGQDAIIGAFNLTTAASNVSTCWLDYPFVTDEAID